MSPRILAEDAFATMRPAMQAAEHILAVDLGPCQRDRTRTFDAE